MNQESDIDFHLLSSNPTECFEMFITRYAQGRAKFLLSRRAKY